MSDTTSSPFSRRKLKQQLAINLKAALCVAGVDQDGKASKLLSVDIVRKTGMSRTTLRPILEVNDANGRNPDLETIDKLAKTLGVPLAFLLMTPDDWRVLTRVAKSFGHYQQAANGLVTDELGSPALAERVLKRLKVHPDPMIHEDDPNLMEIKRLEARNAFRRRCSLVLSALAQPAARGDREYFVDLTALASAMALEMTPTNPDT